MAIGDLKGHARPSRALLERLGHVNGHRHASNIESMLDDLTAVDSLACLLTEAIEKSQTKDGRIDMRDVAAHVLREMRRHPK